MDFPTHMLMEDTIDNASWLVAHFDQVRSVIPEQETPFGQELYDSLRKGFNDLGVAAQEPEELNYVLWRLFQHGACSLISVNTDTARVYTSIKRSTFVFDEDLEQAFEAEIQRRKREVKQLKKSAEALYSNLLDRM